MSENEPRSSWYLYVGLILSCGVVGCQNHGKESAQAEQQYRKAHQAWREHINADPNCHDKANATPFIDNPPFKAIVDLGENALPFLIRDLEKSEEKDSDHLLHFAVQRITKLDVARLYPNNTLPMSDRDRSRLWVRWWRDKRGLSTADNRSFDKPPF